MRFSKYYFDEAQRSGSLLDKIPDPSSVGKSSTGEHIWQKDDYLINRWVKKGILALAKGLGRKVQEKPEIKNTTIDAKDFTFREITRAAFELVGTTLSKNQMESSKDSAYRIKEMYNVDIKNDGHIFGVKGKAPYSQMLSSDMYVATNGGRIVLVSVLNEQDEIEYYMGSDAKGKVYFAYKFGKSFDGFASSKRPRKTKTGETDRPKVDRDGEGSIDDQLIRALTGEEPEEDDTDDGTDDDTPTKDDGPPPAKDDTPPTKDTESDSEEEEEYTDLIQKAAELVPKKKKADGFVSDAENSDKVDNKKVSKQPRIGSWGYIDISEPMFIYLVDKLGDGKQGFGYHKDNYMHKGDFKRAPYKNGWGEGYKYNLGNGNYVYLIMNDQGIGEIIYENKKSFESALDKGMVQDPTLLDTLWWIPIDPDFMDVL